MSRMLVVLALLVAGSAVSVYAQEKPKAKDKKEQKKDEKKHAEKKEKKKS